jgi:hypothetical protein
MSTAATRGAEHGSAKPSAGFAMFAGLVVALGLLAAFYSVVAHAALRIGGGTGKLLDHAGQQTVCSAFSATSARDLCLVVATDRAGIRRSTGVAAAQLSWEGLPVLTALGDQSRR